MLVSGWITETMGEIVQKDTIRDFDDVSNAFPRRGQVSFVP